MHEHEYENFRLPPHSIEAEQSVLGGLLLDNDAWERIADLVQDADFYREDHRIMFQTITRMVEAGYPVDAITLAEELGTRNTLDYVGGLAYIGSLVQNTPSSANIRRYAEIVREKSVLREMAAASVEITEMAMNPEGRQASELLDLAETKIFRIAESTAKGKQNGREMPSILKNVIEQIDARYQSDDDGALLGNATGFIDFDKMTQGLQPGDLIIVAGRPSMGKTAFAINIAENIGINEKLPVAIFSMEMSDEQLGYRMLSSIGRIDATALRTGKIDDSDWINLTTAVGKLSEANILIDETPALSALEIRARARRYARRHGGKLGLIVVDYLQLMSTPDRRGDSNRASELGEITRALKQLAKELKTPVVALSQLSRKVEERGNKRPMMSDLRESGALEQDADLIVMLYRDEYYNPDSNDKGLAEAIISKQRNGAVGTVALAFNGQYSRFDNFAHSGAARFSMTD